MTIVLIMLVILILAYLFVENLIASSDRKKMKHVIYVNGIRGKSTVTRLIDAALRESGYRVFCKTTGTVPMYIDTSNNEIAINRRGKANIKEQLWILHKAAKQNAEILVCECMAVDPVLQKISQDKMLKSNIGIITNVRLDHTEEMGQTLFDICNSLSNTIPNSGVLFTADENFYNQLLQNAQKNNSECFLCKPSDDLPNFNFKENLALALAVAQHMGVDRQTAIEGMKKFKKDPFELSLHQFKNGAIFINGMSVNDPDSSRMIYNNLFKKYNLYNRNLTLLINNRGDRGYRTQHMLLLAKNLNPKNVIVMGASKLVVKAKLLKQNPNVKVQCVQSHIQIDFDKYSQDDVIYAVGNIANYAEMIMKKVKEEGKAFE